MTNVASSFSQRICGTISSPLYHLPEGIFWSFPKHAWWNLGLSFQSSHQISSPSKHPLSVSLPPQVVNHLAVVLLHSTLSSYLSENLHMVSGLSLATSAMAYQLTASTVMSIVIVQL